MCCSLSGKGGLLIRIDPAECDSVLAEPHVAPMRMGGRTMRGFVRIDSEGFKSDQALERWIRRGLEAAAGHSRNSATRARKKASRAGPRRTRT